MRPKRLVLVLDPNPESLGITMFSLSLHHFRVVGAHTFEQAAKIAEQCEVDAMLSSIKFEHVSFPVPVVFKGSWSMAWCVESLKERCARKRGPKPGFRLKDTNPAVCS